MQPLSTALSYPTNRDGWIRTIAIGGVLTILAFLIVPMFAVYGYLVAVIRERLDDNPEPPRFDDWGRLLVDGLQVFAIGLVYMLIPLIVAGITIGGSIIAFATGTESGAAAGLASLFGGLAISSLLVLVFGYVAVAAIVNFAREGQIGAAFDLATLKQVVTSGDYAIPWLVSVILFVVAGAIAGALNVIPFLGFVIGAFLTFYAYVVAASLWAGGYADALGPGAEISRPESDEATI